MVRWVAAHHDRSESPISLAGRVERHPHAPLSPSEAGLPGAHRRRRISPGHQPGRRRCRRHDHRRPDQEQHDHQRRRQEQVAARQGLQGRSAAVGSRRSCRSRRHRWSVGPRRSCRPRWSRRDRWCSGSRGCRRCSRSCRRHRHTWRGRCHGTDRGDGARRADRAHRCHRRSGGDGGGQRRRLLQLRGRHHDGDDLEQLPLRCLGARRHSGRRPGRSPFRGWPCAPPLGDPHRPDATSPPTGSRAWSWARRGRSTR